ncbi:hypothetical protein MCUN1_001581 [Malassezia cuniculi]|uniref:Uncharacterized protein n=1 Tax=Malassezia cuniculi TaxID=948313 RepID=A0AAF0J5Q6_9BASI|nr:hypothetical protein MCUN1_001581 [Malassezia cuniculi]
MSDPPAQPFLTVGLASQLEPLADLRYSTVQADDGNDSDSSLYVGHGVRLQPEFIKHKLQTLAIVLRVAAKPQTAAAAEAWARVFRALDAADEDPHFSNLRTFLDARARDIEEDALSPTSGGRARAFQWLQKKASNSNLRKPDESVASANRGQDGAPPLCPESFELHGESRIRFNVRLDLHNANLAPHPGQSELPTVSPDTDEEPKLGSSLVHRSSLIHRMLDRNRRKSSFGRSAISSRSWAANHDPRDPAYAEAVDDDDNELATRISRASLTSVNPSGASGPPETGRVDKKNAAVPDILALIREACSASYGAVAEIPTGDADPMPTIFCAAIAIAFGWEGVMHLCYGTGSPGAATAGAFDQLGRAADRDAYMRDKNSSVSTWRENVHAAMEHDELVESQPDNFQDETASLPSQPSVVGDASDTDEGEAEIAIHTLQRTWADWEDMLTSLVWWVIEYETSRVRNGLAQEIGYDSPVRQMHAQPTVHSQPAIAAFRAGTVLTASPAVAADAFISQYGFQRIPGVPATLWHDHEEYTDFRWARKRLRSSHMRTQMTVAISSLQYLVHQMRSPRVIHSAWELVYLDVCVFDSDVMRTRFPPPGSNPVPFAASYNPGTDKVDRRKPCPMPDVSGAWSAEKWKAWLGTLHGGNIITPAVSWQAWWTLIATLNGSDRTGRWFNLQVKDPNESYADLKDISSVYI